MNTEPINEIVNEYAIYLNMIALYFDDITNTDTKPLITSFWNIRKKIGVVIENTKTFVEFLNLMKHVINMSEKYLDEDLKMLVHIFSVFMIKKHYPAVHFYSIDFGAEIIEEWETYFKKELEKNVDRGDIMKASFNGTLVSKMKYLVCHTLKDCKDSLEYDCKCTIESFTRPHYLELSTLPKDNMCFTSCFKKIKAFFKN